MTASEPTSYCAYGCTPPCADTSPTVNPACPDRGEHLRHDHVYADVSAAIRSQRTPHPALVVGDRDSTRTLTDVPVGASELARRVRSACVLALTRRAHWAAQGTEIGAARAVAYQTMAGLLQRALEDEPPPAPTPAGTTVTVYAVQFGDDHDWEEHDNQESAEAAIADYRIAIADPKSPEQADDYEPMSVVTCQVTTYEPHRTPWVAAP